MIPYCFNLQEFFKSMPLKVSTGKMSSSTKQMTSIIFQGLCY